MPLDPALTARAQAFAAEVESFLAFLEAAPGRDRLDFLVELTPRLGSLIGLGATLPHVEPDESYSGDGPDATPAIEALPGRLVEVLGEWSTYREVFDPLAPEGEDYAEVVGASLPDDLGDLARDLERGLLLLRADDVASALWKWRFDFHSHWGLHAADALRAVVWRLAAEDHP